MKLSCTFEDNILPDVYAKKAKVQVKGNAVVSFPFTIEDVPEKRKVLHGHLLIMILFLSAVLLIFIGLLPMFQLM